MSFRVFKGKVKKVQYPVATSTAFSAGACVEFGSGTINPSDDNDTQIAGVIQKAIAATDSDYATARSVGVLVPVERHVVWEVDGLSGFSSSDVGGEYGISSSLLLDQSDTSNKVFLVTEVVSASKVRGYLKINGSY